MRKIFFVATVLFAVVFSPGAATAQYPPGGGAAVNPCAEPHDSSGKVTTSFSKGARVTVTGVAGCAGPNQAVALYVDSVKIAQGTANADGSYSLTGTLPSNISAGSHRLIIDLGANGVGVGPQHEQAITVSLPATGANIFRFFKVGTFMLLAGAALIAMTWQRLRSRPLAADAGGMAFSDEHFEVAPARTKVSAATAQEVDATFAQTKASDHLEVKTEKTGALSKLDELRQAVESWKSRE